MLRLDFQRRSNDTVYRFDRCAARHGHSAWKRDDLDLWLVRLPEAGWRVIDGAGAMRASPDATLEALGPASPLGRWQSDKDGKSYAYDLRATQAGAP